MKRKLSRLVSVVLLFCHFSGASSVMAIMPNNFENSDPINVLFNHFKVGNLEEQDFPDDIKLVRILVNTEHPDVDIAYALSCYRQAFDCYDKAKNEMQNETTKLFYDSLKKREHFGNKILFGTPEFSNEKKHYSETNQHFLELIKSYVNKGLDPRSCRLIWDDDIKPSDNEFITDIKFISEWKEALVRFFAISMHQELGFCTKDAILFLARLFDTDYIDNRFFSLVQKESYNGDLILTPAIYGFDEEEDAIYYVDGCKFSLQFKFS